MCCMKKGKWMVKVYDLVSESKSLDEHPGMVMNFYNRGIAGDTIVKLKERWDTDCMSLRPAVVSLLIGVNDYQVSLQATGAGDVRKFKNEYEELLQMTLDQLPKVRLVIGEPFALNGRSEEHTSELQSLMRISYAVFCLKKKK